MIQRSHHSVLILAIHPAPYRDPALVCLAEDERFEIVVYYYDRLDVGHREWEYLGAGALPLPQHLADARRYRTLQWLLRSIAAIGRSDIVIVPGYSRAVSLATVGTCLLVRTPYIVTLDTTRATGQGGVRGLLRKHAISRAAGFWVAGSAAREYLQEHWAVKADLIAEGAYCLDGESLHAEVVREQETSHRLRAKMRIGPKTFVFLSVGKLHRFRRFPHLISEFLAASEQGPPMHLIVIGEGEDERRIFQGLDCNQVPITHLDAVRYSHLARYYALADCYVHAGVEPYSTAVEFAAVAGLPIVANAGVGYVADLVRLGGRVFNFGVGGETLSARLVEVAKSPYLASEAGRQNRHASSARRPSWAAHQLAALIGDLLGR